MRLKNLLKLIIGIISSVIIIFFLYILSLWYNVLFPSGEAEVIYIHHDYNKNFVIVVYNEKNGERKEKIDGKRIFRIPKSGILFTQFDLQKKLHNRKLFYVNENGKPTLEIKYLDFIKNYMKIEKYQILYYTSPGYTYAFDYDYYIIGDRQVFKDENDSSKIFKIVTNKLDSIGNVSKSEKK